MSMELVDLEKSLQEVEENLKKVEILFHQLSGQKTLLLTLIESVKKNIKENKKDGKDKK